MNEISEKDFKMFINTFDALNGQNKRFVMQRCYEVMAIQLRNESECKFIPCHDINLRD